MARLRALDLVRPFTVLMPEVQKPYGKVDQYERIIYVVCGGFLYVVLSELPLFGVTNTIDGTPDALGYLRAVTGSANGTPIDIGPSVIYLSGFILQILAGYKLLNVSLDLRSDRGLFQSAQKLLAIFLTAFLAILSVLSGTYGSPGLLGYRNCAFLIVQLIGGNLALILIDEVLTKGHGLGTGLLLFSSIKCAQQFSWDLFSMVTVESVRGPQTIGVLPTLGFNLNSRSIKYAFTDAAFRKGLPNALTLLFALIAFFIVVWFSTLRVNLQISSTRARSQQQNFPIRLFYTNATPILFTASFLSVLITINTCIYSLAPLNPWVGLFGKWVTEGSRKVPVGGLIYYLTAPTSFEPIRALSYGLFVTVLSGVFARLWAESSGFSARDMARTFKDQSIVLVGRRDQSIQRELRKTLDPIALLGGLVTGIIAAIFDILSGYGMIIVAGCLNMLNVFEVLGNENISQESLMGQARG